MRVLVPCGVRWADDGNLIGVGEPASNPGPVTGVSLGVGDELLRFTLAHELVGIQLDLYDQGCIEPLKGDQSNQRVETWCGSKLDSPGPGPNCLKF